MNLRFLRVAYHLAVYTIGITVLLAAVTVTIIRVALPDIGIYRGEVEAWVSRYMGFPVVIRSVNATWYGWIPHLHIANIDLLNKAGTQPITHFESAQISIDPIATLLRRQFIPKQLTISGFELSVVRQADGSINIAGVEVSDGNDNLQGDNELAEWLFKQEHIRIKEATVEWEDLMHRQDPVLLTGVTLSLRSDGDRLQIDGSTTLPAVFGRQMDFAFDGTGDLLTADWSGELYISASDINPDNWYRDYRPLNINIAGGSADIQVWSTWKTARLDRVDGELRYRDFAAMVGDASLRVEELDYRFEGRRATGGGWHLNMHLADLLTENGLWPAVNFRMLSTPVSGSDGHRYAVNFDFLKLEDLTPLLSRLSFIPDAVRERVSALSLEGALTDGSFDYDPSAGAGEQFSYDVGFNNVSSRGSGEFPVRATANGRVTGNLNGGAVRFDDDHGRVSFPSMEIGELRLTELNGEVTWTRSADKLEIRSPALSFDTDDFTARLTGGVTMALPGMLPAIDLAVDISETDLESIRRYVPVLPGFRLREWLERAVVSGRLVSGSAVVRGNLGEFPFDAGNGRFQAIFNVEDTLLEYSDQWPAVFDLNAAVGINGRKMHADVSHGTMFSARVARGTVDIGDFLDRQKVIAIDGSITGSTKDLAQFVDESPLERDPLLQRVRHSLSGGDMRMDLRMDIPLRLPDRHPEITGAVTLDGARLKSELGNFTLEDLNGTIHFTRDSASGKEISATFLERPVSVAVSGTKGREDDPPGLVINGFADEEFIMDRLAQYFPGLESSREPLLERMRGGADWELHFTIPATAPGVPAAGRLELVSSLEGLMLDLPEPLGKPMNGVRELRIERDLDPERPAEIGISYGPGVSSRLRLDEGGAGLARAALHFGSGESVSTPRAGLELSGRFESLSITDWWHFLRELGGDGSPAAARGFNVDLRVESLEFMHRTFPEVAVTGTAVEQGLNLELQSPQVAGSITLPSQGAADQRVRLNLQRLHITGAGSRGPATESMDPRRLPALSLDIAELQYNELALGRLLLDSTPTPRGMSIDRFEFLKPDLKVNGAGEWGYREGEHSSLFHISLHANKIDSMLQTFGYNVAAISNGETDLTIDAAWEGSPMQFSLDRLDGSLGIKIRKGQLLEIDPKAGRLFGLLSIQTLPRRLSLDFSDLFGKGMAFDVIEGSFDISNGDAYTNDLYMRGPSADVIVTGRTGLAEQDYDQIVTVTPQISSTLPVASALFGPVGMGVGAVLYLAGEVFDVFQNKIDTLLSYQYTITGSWADPVIEEYETAGEKRASG